MVSTPVVRPYSWRAASLVACLLVASAVPEDDLRCLKGMKDFILDPDKNMNWNFASRTDGSVCSFKGVSCWNPLENRVLSLSLNSMSLSGTIPSSLQYCSSTANLDLSGNLFSGPIPPDLCRWLPFLTTLDLSGNQLSGSIPPDLSNCSYLNILLLSGNQLSGPIPPSLDRLQRLRRLDLSSNQLSGAIPARLATSFAASTFSGNPALCGYPLSSGCSRHSLSRASLIIIVVGVVGAVTLCSYVAAYWIWKSRNTKSLPTANMKDQHMPKVSYAELAEATDGFAPTNLIGEGSFGSVYKGIMVLDGTRKFVAVKVINLREKRALKSFAAECEALKNIRHRNLLKILTLCSSVDFQGNDFKALVFDYMTNGSLEEWLHHRVNERGDESKSFLDFFQRLSIAIDVASALDYLHQQVQTPIVHCDLKPSNVLIDGDMTAHVADFGLTRFITESSSSVISISSIGLKGSIGYISPEYGMGAKVSTKGDVYSYGILLLHMFTGKSPTDHTFKEGLSLHMFVAAAVSDRAMDVADPSLFPAEEDEAAGNDARSTTRGIAYEYCLVSVLRIGLRCSKESPKERMRMADVVKELHAIRDVFLGTGLQGERRRRAQQLRGDAPFTLA